ncbi:MAG TPA: protease pro-enzyme activation domain-containing protein [Candidatus Acidoferrales bacterium]|nr:protease pro-enzyme activation domain-containing protein [Candidatus Acidoferrales bacterium]
MKKIISRLWLSITAFLLLQIGFSIDTMGQQVLHGHVPRDIARFGLHPIAQLDSTKHLELTIGLPLRNQQGLFDLLRELYDPTSQNFRHWLSPEQFTGQFGPTQADYQSVIAFAQRNGFTVTNTYPNRMLLDVSATVRDIEKALHVQMLVYKHPIKSRNFYAPDRDPSFDLATPVLSIGGLSDYAFIATRTKTNSPTSQNPSPSTNNGSGPGYGYDSKDFRAAYAPGVSLKGSGQAVGLLQFDGYYASDVSTYESKTGLSAVMLDTVLLDGFDGNVIPYWTGEEEVTLDIEMAIAMAPALSKVIVYETSPYGDVFQHFEHVLNRMATDDAAMQLSCSWGLYPDSVVQVADQSFQQMAAQGQSFFNASGDEDAIINSTWISGGDTVKSYFTFPSSDPYITQVGGTHLTLSAPGGSYVSETVWNTNTYQYYRYAFVGSSGGSSLLYSIPSWQQGVNMSNNQGSTTKRNVPDVALVADSVYEYVDGVDIPDQGGTSCAAPLWAGFTALVNQQLAANGGEYVGFINPSAYWIGANNASLGGFHDIATGNNAWPGSSGKFSAVSGYDLCTGWGTPYGQNLINAITASVWAGTVNISSNFTVPSGVSLLVLPGTHVTFSNGASLIVNGALNVAGTASSPITFDFGSPNSSTQNGITVNGCSSCYPNAYIRYATIEHAYRGVYGNNTVPDIEYCTITANTFGIYLNNASTTLNIPQIDNNSITSNSSDGIIMYNSSPRWVQFNTIKYNGRDGINCVTGSTPYIYCCTMSNNGNQGIDCESNSPAHLSDQYNDPGHNVLRNNSSNGVVASSSNVYMGSSPPGLNSVTGNSSLCVVAVYGSHVSAEYNYWVGHPPAPLYYVDGTSSLDASNPLSSDPNSGRQTDQANAPSLVSVSQRVSPSGTLAATSTTNSQDQSFNADATFMDAGLADAFKSLVSGKFDDAIAQYASKFTLETDSQKRIYELEQLAECYRSANRTDFSGFLVKQVYPGLSTKDPLYAKALELESLFLISAGEYDAAISNYSTLLSNFSNDGVVCRDALFNLGYLYRVELNDNAMSGRYWSQLKAKYPTDNLTWHSEVLSGKIQPTVPNTDVSQNAKVTSPVEFGLLNNFPNPFNPTTRIEYNLPKGGYVTLKVYDILGREVVTLVNENQETGIHFANFDGLRLGSGVYLYHLIAPGINQVKKMSLMK